MERCESLLSEMAIILGEIRWSLNGFLGEIDKNISSNTYMDEKIMLVDRHGQAFLHDLNVLKAAMTTLKQEKGMNTF